jgi:hypothetical protein
MNEQEALAYILRALTHAGITGSKTFAMKDIPDILDAYDEIEPLDSVDVATVSQCVTNMAADKS